MIWGLVPQKPSAQREAQNWVQGGSPAPGGCGCGQPSERPAEENLFRLLAMSVLFSPLQLNLLLPMDL